MLLNNQVVTNHAIWCVMELWRTATFTFRTFSMFTPWTVRNNIHSIAEFSLLPRNPVVFFYEHLGQIHVI